MLYRITVEFHKDFVEVNGDEIKVGLVSRPVDGQANRELVKKLAKHFGVSSSMVSIKSGARSRTKIVEIVSP